MKHRTSLGCLAIVAAVVVGSTPVAASEPGPVIAVDPQDPPAYDPTEPYQDDQGGRCPAGNTRMSPDGVIELNLPAGLELPAEMNLRPGPVVAVDPAPAAPAAPCLSDLRLDLIVEAPDDKKPEGADANLDGIAVSRPALEGGFEVTLPAQDRSITFTDPGENWELKSTVCSCSGWTTMTASTGSAIAMTELAAYPGPVVPVEPPPPGGPGGCSGSAPGVLAPMAAAPVTSMRASPTEITAYPAPVLPVVRLEAPRVEWDAAGNVTITDPDAVGGTFTCVWTVELVYGQLDIETVTKPRGEEDRFRYQVVPTGGQPDASPFTATGGASERLRWGPWSVDIADVPEGWKVKRSNCSEADTSLLSRAEGPTATVGLDPDDAVSCRFELELLAPKPGRWRANNKAGTVVCSKGRIAIPFDLTQAIDFGRLRVRDEGDTLVARGRGNSFTWRRDRDDPLRYVGTKRYRQGGYTLDFDIRLNLRSETRMTGSFKAVAKGNGARCTARRPLVLTHASGN